MASLPSQLHLHCRPEKKNHWALASLLSLLLVALLFYRRPFQPTEVHSHTHHHPPTPHSPKAAVFGDGSSSSPSIAPSISPLAQRPADSPAYTAYPPKAVILEEKGWSPPAGRSGEGRAGSTAEKSRGRRGKCDLYSGRWVKDPEGGYPLYPPGSCPFVETKFACQENGRQDREYLKWRWEPDGCHLPRFNASDFLNLLRGKVMMFVGDSFSRNQYESMQCLLRKAVFVNEGINQSKGYVETKRHGYFSTHFPEYNCSVEYQRSYYLVRRGLALLDGERKSRPTLQIDLIDESAEHWKTANILIFNTGHWWTRYKTNGGRYFYQEGNTVYPKLTVIKAYKRALQTWVSWVNKNLKPQEKIVFFRGLGNSDFSGGSWDSGGKCDRETEPAFKRQILDRIPWQMNVINELVHGMQFPIRFLNVTRLTNFRKDAHPSIYGVASAVIDRNSSVVQDCSHWCLPGLPDVWNELLYANLCME